MSMQSPCAMKSGFIRLMASLEKEGGNLIAFYYPIAFEIWPDQKSGLP